MKISQLIEELQEIKDSYGDLHVYYYDTELGEWEILTTVCVNSNFNAVNLS